MKRSEKKARIDTVRFRTQEGKIVFNHAPVNTLLEEMEFLRNGFYTKAVFIINGEEEIDTDRFFRESRVLAEIIKRKVDKMMTVLIYFT